MRPLPDGWLLVVMLVGFVVTVLMFWNLWPLLLVPIPLMLIGFGYEAVESFIKRHKSPKG